jgi:hypothetical protein
VAAAGLRAAGLHPTVLSRDPLAQLFDPRGGARLLVPEPERAAALRILEGDSGPAREAGEELVPARRRVPAGVIALALLAICLLSQRGLLGVLGVALLLLVVLALARGARR